MRQMKKVMNIQELEAIIDDKTITLYGAGKVARTIIKYLSKKNCVIDRILVSTMYNNPSEIMGIRVEELSNEIDSKQIILLVCSLEGVQGEIIEEIDKYEFASVSFMTDELFHNVIGFLGDYEIDSYYEIKQIQMRQEKFLKFVPRPCLEYLIVNILDHCNLRCKGCDHFACIADPYFVPYETIHRDLERLAEIMENDYIVKIAVMGGEPLLHPDLLKILQDVRRCFPHATIRLTTNGLLLLQQGEEFWRVCRENKVTIVNTKYPINLDFEKMQERAKEEGVTYKFFEGTGNHLVKKSFKKMINLKGDSDPVESFMNCSISNYGNFLMEGKLYGCPFSCQSNRIFNKKFDENLRITEKDYLVLDDIKDKSEIFEFAAKPKFYCRYCVGLSSEFDWTRSKQEKSEWV